MVCGVNARQRWKQVQTIQITIVFKSRIQIKWFVELMQGNVGNKFKPFKYPFCLNHEYRLDGLWS